MAAIEMQHGGLLIPYNPELELTREDVAPIRWHINADLPNLIRYPHEVKHRLAIPLQHPFMVPSSENVEGFSYDDQQFGWDSHFNSILLMLEGEEYFPVAVGMLENALDMYEKYGVNPNSSLYIRLGHGQPPFLTTYAFNIYNTYKDTHPEINQEWLSKKIAIIKQEYQTVWMGTEDPHNRLAYRGLSRYYDPDLTDDHVQAESGWDYTPRFDGEAYNYLPADLNALLYKYEIDFAREAGMRGDEPEMRAWLHAAQTRKDTMYEVMYDKKKGVYHDYNYKTHQPGPVDSLASYTAMWAGMVERRSEQAEEMVGALKLFEHMGGLAVTEEFEPSLYEKRKLQWRKPNAWSPQTIITVDGLEICGFPDDARRIALKSLRAKVEHHKKHSVILEAYNAVYPDQMPAPGMYPRQVGFGWTDAEIEYFSAKYIDQLDLSYFLMRDVVLAT